MLEFVNNMNNHFDVCLFKVFFQFIFVFMSRQLEAIIRISESLAKMKLQPFATDADVDEALRLFQVSTLDAAMSGNLAGMFYIL